MSTKYIASNWRLPNQENSSKSDNYGLDFDSTEYVEFNSFPDIAENNCYSFAFWFKTSSTSNAQVICSSAQTNLFELRTRFSAIQVIDAIGSRVSTTQQLQTTVAEVTNDVRDGEWHHIVFIANTQTNDPTISNDYVANLYLDGYRAVEVAFGSPSTLAGVMASTLRLNNTFVGEVSEICFFNRILTDGGVNQYELAGGEVAQLYGSSSLGAGNPMALKPQPVAYYPLGDNSASNPLTQPNEAVEDASVFDFDGSTSYIDCGNNSSLQITSNLTVSAWFKLLNNSTNEVIVARDNGSGDRNWSLRVANTGQVYGLIRKSDDSGWGGDVLSPSAYDDGNWHHAAMIYTPSTSLVLYVDGVAVATDTTDIASAINNDAAGLTIGGFFQPGFTGEKFDGEISNVAIWNSDQSSEISNIYNSGVPATSYTNTPTAWYKLDQSANWEADSSGNWQIPDAVSAYPQSFDFDGSDYIDGGSASYLNGLSEFTLSCWFKLDTAANNNTIISDWMYNTIGGKFALQTTDFSGSDFALLIFIRNSVTDAGNNVAKTNRIFTQGNWYNLVFSFNSSSCQFYINGSPVTTTITGTIPTSLLNQNGNLNIGKFGGTLTRYFNGKISNVQIWDTALSATQAETIYNDGVPLTTAIASDNLKAWYKLNDNEKFDGTNWSVENQKYPAGFDSALSFDGSNDYIDTGAASFSGLTEMSVSAWVKPTATGTGAAEAILSTEASSPNRGFYLSLFVGSKFRWQVSTDGSNKDSLDNGTIVLNEWTHIVATWNQSTMNLYVNGSLAGTMSTVNATGTFSTTNNMFIGQRTSGAGYFPGDISNVAFYNTVLDSSAVTTLYNNGTPETSISSSPVSWWKLDNTTTGIQDSAGSNDGTNNGATKVNTFVSTEAATSSGMTEQNLVNNNVSVLNGESSGMTSANLVLSDLSRSLPYGDGYSFNFDAASSDYIDCGTGLSLLGGACTFSAWCYMDDATSFRILHKGFTTTREYAFGTGTADKLFFILYNQSTAAIGQTSTSTITAYEGEWIHLAATYDGSGNNTGIQLYINGVAIAQTAYSLGSYTAPAALGGDVYIGRYNLEYADGKISNLSVFDSELSSTEVLKLYANGIPQDLTNFNPQPQAWWPLGSNSFWNGSQWTVRDMSTGGSNDGTGQNIGQDGLVGDAPRSEANGTGTNMDVPTNLEGSTKWSDNNSWSINMSETARVEDTP